MAIFLYTSQRLMEKLVQTVQQQPKPLPFKRLHASNLEDFDDQLPSSPALERHRPEESVVTQWLESISGSETYRERHCRSDSLLGHSDGELIPRRLTKSAPNMDYNRETDGFALPPTPYSTESQSYRADAVGGSQVSYYASSVALSDISGASTGSSRKKVEDPLYRQNNLAVNNIYMRDFYEDFPEDIAGLVDHVRKDRESPGLSPDQLRQNTRLYDLEMGTAEPAVENYFKANIFPDPGRSDSLKRIDKNPMAKQVVPDVGSALKVSTPVPDMLYGYNRYGAFPQQQAQLISMGTQMVANTQDLIYPFFVIEFKADGPGGSGSMWVATNQCLGGSVSCVNIAERLNRQLRECKSKKVQSIGSAAFSIAMTGTEARLYVSWKHNDLEYYMRKVDSFLLQKPKDYVEFRKYVRNIIDWGRDKRLKEIRDSLDILLEKNRKTASQQAKSRPPPSDDSASSTHKRKDSRRGKMSDHNQVSASVQDSQSSHYQGYYEYNPPAPQAASSSYEYSTDALQPVNASYEYSADASQPLTSSYEDNPDTSHVRNYDPLDTPTCSPVTPHSSENVSLPVESHESVDDSSTRDHRRTRRTQGSTDITTGRKTRKRH